MTAQWQELTGPPFYEAFYLVQKEGLRGFPILIRKEHSPLKPLFLDWKIFSLARNKENLGFVLLYKKHFVFPLFLKPLKGIPPLDPLSWLINDRKKHWTLMAFEQDLAPFNSLVPKKENQKISYHYFLGTSPLPALTPRPDLRIMRITKDQGQRFFPLREAYEKEEVLLPGQWWNQKASWANWKKSLEKFPFFALLSEKEEPLALAGINGQYKDFHQIGGVYTSPDHRGKGYASVLISHLSKYLGPGNLGLYVKTSNQRGIRLYENLGFKKQEDFHIHYHFP